MHDQQNYFDKDAYKEFIQHQSYIDNTQNNPLLIIFEPTPTSTNPMESQSQNIVEFVPKSFYFTHFYQHLTFHFILCNYHAYVSCTLR